MALLEAELQETHAVEQAIANLTEQMFEALPWLEHLPVDECGVLVSELLGLAQKGPPIEEVAAFLREWRATAEAYADEGAIAELLEPADDEEPIPLRRGA